jgi:hypothetical protein
MARPGRFELPTLCLEGRRSIQLSYGRFVPVYLIRFCRSNSTLENSKMSHFAVRICLRIAAALSPKVASYFAYWRKSEYCGS